MTEVDSRFVNEALLAEEWKVIDTRSSHQFIGWMLPEDLKKGHIKGATDFSKDWLNYCTGNEKKRLQRLKYVCEYKGFDADKKYILYDSNHSDALNVYEYFKSIGLGRCVYYNFNNWQGETIWYPRYYRMVPVWWVWELINNGKPEFHMGNDYKILEVSWGKPCKKYLEAHIPGSIHIDSEEYERGEEWIRPSDEELKKFACRHGIRADTTVVIYCMEGQGAIHKLAVILEYMGVKNIFCLNGSMHNWVEAGYPTESGVNEDMPIEDFGAEIPRRPEVIADMENVRAMLNKQEKGLLVDMRPWEAYIGIDTEYGYVPVAGRIPGSIWCHEKYHYFNPDDTMGNLEEMIEHWKTCGLDLDERLVFICGSGAW